MNLISGTSRLWVRHLPISPVLIPLFPLPFLPVPVRFFSLETSALSFSCILLACGNSQRHQPVKWNITTFKDFFFIKTALLGLMNSFYPSRQKMSIQIKILIFCAVLVISTNVCLLKNIITLVTSNCPIAKSIHYEKKKTDSYRKNCLL